MVVRIESQAEPIPGYKLVERLGGGGFGEVWKAIAPGGLHKAIKFVYGDLHAVSDDGVRAEQELKALSRVKMVRHPYILSLERYDILDGQLIIVMELADRNLWDRFKECRSQGLPGIPRDELLRYMQEASEALDLMNIEYQLQHLDIKPQNLFLVHQHAKVADFGLVKDLQGVMASVTGGITPVYAAPETFDGWISRFCDQYSLAIVYQELLTGQRPFNGNNVGQLIMQHLRASPNLGSLPAGDREAVSRALAKNPDERFPRCQVFMEALCGNAATQSVPALGAPTQPRSPASADSDPLASPVASAPGDLTPAQTRDDTPTFSMTKARESDIRCTPVRNASPAPGTEDARWIRVRELAEPKPEERPNPAVLASHVQRDGVLFPALVIGLGETGLAVLQRLRQSFQEAFGGVDALPNIRWLYIDTDPAALQLATREPGGVSARSSGAALSPADVLQTRLNRPSHYLRAYHGRPRLETWFDLKMLYRIPRNPATTGLRVLGRLAFFDHYRAIAARLNKELEACTRPEVLAAAAQLPGFGLRTLRPRAYVVASLAGGTGGGMFLDLAYVLRKLQRAQGHACPDLVGLFFLPTVDRSPGQTMALANVFAALTELNHYSAPETCFWSHYEDHEPPVRDSEPPYGHCFLMPLPPGGDDSQMQAQVGLVADWLYHDLTTPFGRTADESRAGISMPAPKSWTFTCHTFGMYQISWPRFAFLRYVGRNLCQQLVQDWLSKDATPVRERVKAAVEDEWCRLGLGGDQLLTRLQKACAQAFGQDPEDAFAALVEPLAQALPALTQPGSPGMDFTQAVQLIDELEQLVGRPDENVGCPTGTLQEFLDAAADEVSTGLGKHLGAFISRFIEQSGARLAGAEEAVRQFTALIEQELQKQECLGKELAVRAENAHAGIHPLMASLQENAPRNRRAAASVNTFLELLRHYPKWRYQSLMFRRLSNVYVSLRGQLCDQLQEIHYCRSGLSELLGSFQTAESEEPRAESQERFGSSLSALRSPLHKGRCLFPAGFRTLADAAKHMLASITPEELRQLDALMQKLLQAQFQSLAHVCLTSANLLAKLEEAMQRQAEAFVDARLAGVNVADMYLAHHDNDQEAHDDLDTAFEAAAPALSPRARLRERREPVEEICIVAAPPGPAGERFRDLARRALPDVNLVAAAGTDDIVFYRELPSVRLSDLEQLGPLGYEAYRHIVSTKNLTPHSRTDISEWRAASG